MMQLPGQLLLGQMQCVFVNSLAASQIVDCRNRIIESSVTVILYSFMTNHTSAASTVEVI